MFVKDLTVGLRVGVGANSGGDHCSACSGQTGENSDL